jgi:transposase-like protein
MTNPKTDNPELNLATLFADYAAEDRARELLESLRWPNGAVCPHCAADKPYKLTMKSDSKSPVRAGLYKCRKCRKQFTFKVGSIFEDSKIQCSKWCMAIALLCSSKKAVSSHQIHRMLGVTQKTAWFMLHRIRHAFAPIFAAQKLSGSVEIDEAMFGIKNQPKMQVVALIERGGEVRTKIVDRISHRNIGSFMRDNIARGSTVNTDSNPRYKGVYLPAIKHESVNHSQKEFIREKPDGSKVHVNHCESFFSLLKRGVTGAFHHISKEHLHRYCDEFSFRWNTRKLTDGERFGEAVALTAGKRLKYRETIATV